MRAYWQSLGGALYEELRVVPAVSDDLALIKEIAARRGVPEAQIIREGIHLAAMSNRVWDGSFDWPTFDGSGDPEALRSWIPHAGSSAGTQALTWTWLTRSMLPWRHDSFSCLMWDWVV